MIATGAAPFIIPVPGKDLPGDTCRGVEDTNAMIAASAAGKKAVVIGGGLPGLAAAAGMAGRGAEVTVIHLMGHLMERQLDPAAGYLLQKDLAVKSQEFVHPCGSSAGVWRLQPNPVPGEQPH